MKYLVNGLEVYPLLCSFQHFNSNLDDNREGIYNEFEETNLKTLDDRRYNIQSIMSDSNRKYLVGIN